MNEQLALIEPAVQVAFSRVWAMPHNDTIVTIERRVGDGQPQEPK